MKRKRYFEITGKKLPEGFMDKEILEYGILLTSLGTVEFYGPLTREELEEFNMDENLINFRPSEKQFEALKYIAEKLEGLIFTACHKKTIIGYVGLLKPEFSRWKKAAKKELPELIELGAFEVSMMWRDESVGKGMLKWSFNNYDFEDKIVISLETVHNWKLMDPNATILDHRKMLERVLGTVGLEPRTTDDPEILEHPENMLTARIGKKVSKEARQKFEKLLIKNKNLF